MYCPQLETHSLDRPTLVFLRVTLPGEIDCFRCAAGFLPLGYKPRTYLKVAAPVKLAFFNPPPEIFTGSRDRSVVIPSASSDFPLTLPDSLVGSPVAAIAFAVGTS